MVLSFSRARHVTSVRRHPFCLVHRASIRTQTKRIYREAIDTVLVHMEKHVPSTKQVPCASGKKKVKKQQVLNAYYFGSATTSPVVTSIRAGSTGKSQALPCSKQASTWHLAVHGCCVYIRTALRVWDWIRYCDSIKFIHMSHWANCNATDHPILK